MESNTKNKRGGCLFWIFIIAAVVAFFTNPDQADFDQYIENEILIEGNQESYYNFPYIYVPEQYRQSTTVKDYYLFSIYKKEKRLYRNYHYANVNKPSYKVKSIHIGLFGDFWRYEKKYWPLNI